MGMVAMDCGTCPKTGTSGCMGSWEMTQERSVCARTSTDSRTSLCGACVSGHGLRAGLGRRRRTRGRHERDRCTITYADGVMGVESVTAETVSTDESLSVSFIGQNEIDTFQVTGDASVAVGFSGENSVEDIEAYDTSNVVVNMDSNNEFQDLEANDSSSLTVRVTGEVSCEAIKGYDDASVTVEGTTSPTGDKIVVGEGEDSERIGTECGDLVVRDVSVVMEAEEAAVASEEGNVYVYNSSIEGGYSNERTDIYAGGELYVDESVVNVTGTMRSSGHLPCVHPTWTYMHPKVTTAPGAYGPRRPSISSKKSVAKSRTGCSAKRGSSTCRRMAIRPARR